MHALCRRVLLAPVNVSSLRHAASSLNVILDLKRRDQPAPQEQVKALLSGTVMPMLHYTSIGSEKDKNDVRRTMAQLIRDATFAGIVVRARPTSAFVRALVDCVVKDRERIQFIPKMSSVQASRIIEHFCHLGVRERAAYAALCSRVDFSSLKEVARVMFALVEAELDEEVILFVLPMYCGERWELQVEGKVAGASPTGPKVRGGCNVFEAVRVLRALSKAVRKVVEVERQRWSSGSGAGEQKVSSMQLSVQSMHSLRANTLSFILSHEEVLRGAHWINVMRAMLHFPPEYAHLRGVEPAVAKRVLRAIGREDGAASAATEVLTTDCVAAYAAERLFGPGTPQGSEQKAGGKGGPPGRPVGGVLDASNADLIKLLRLIDHVQSTPAQRQARTEFILTCIAKDIHRVDFGGLLLVIRALRQIEHSSAFRGVLDTYIEEVSARLRSDADLTISIQRLVQLSVLLAAFRVKSCRGFAEHLEKRLTPDDGGAPRFAREAVDMYSAASLLSALASTAVQDCPVKSGKVALLLCRELAAHQPGAAPPLISLFPAEATKLLRSLATLNVTPGPEFLRVVFGDEASRPLASLTPALRSHGASIVFDTSRSLLNFHSTISSETGDHACVEATLWRTGCLHTLLPLCQLYTAALEAHNAQGSTVEASVAVRYVPLAWRSAIETLVVFVDLNVDRLSLEEVHQRVREMLPPVLEILRHATRIAHLQLRAVTRRELALTDIHYSGNAILHVIFLALMVEHIIYHGSWQSEVHHRSAVDTAPAIGAAPGDYFAAQCKVFETLLHEGVLAGDEGSEEQLSLLSLFEAAFPPQPQGMPPGQPLISRHQILEITTHLPFAFALAVRPGPLNTFFTERAASLMVPLENAVSS